MSNPMALEAGLDLDQWIGIHVLGWQLDTGRWKVPRIGTLGLNRNAGKVIPTWYEGDRYLGAVYQFRFSSDSRAALFLANHLRTSGWLVSCTGALDGWECRVVSPEGRESVGTAPDLEFALCRAVVQIQH